MHLEHMGVTFHRNEQGEMDLRAFGGASMKRTAYVADITGQALLHVLYEQLLKHHETVERYEEWFTTSLLTDDAGSCCGVIARDVRSGRMETFAAKNVILACGGAGQAYKPTTNGLIVTGDGIALAYRVGAPLMDMEMVQYHPTCLVETGILITEGARGEGAHLLNSAGERFMEKSAPNKMELASRDVVSRAEQIEINEGRGVGPGGAGIFLDVTVVPRRRTLEALREIVNLGRDFAGVDITEEPIMIRPGQHYIMGGVKTDVEGRTPIEGLYAAGEVACVSVHGGNRLGANSLLDTLIFGRRSGEHAAARAASMGMPKVDMNGQLREDAANIDSIIARPREGRRVSEIKNELGELMNRHAAVFRDEQGLQGALETIGRLKEETSKAWIDDRGTVFNQDVLGAIELGFMVDCAETIVVGCARAQGVAGGAVPHRLPRAQRQRVAQAHRHHPRRGRPGGQLLAGHDHPVAAGGEEILMARAAAGHPSRPLRAGARAMAEAHDRPPERFTIRVRRYDPESGEAPHWDEHTIELEPHRSVLEAVLQARDRFDGSIGIRCSCRQAICGSCGVRVNGEPALACHTHLDAARSSSRDGVIEIEPMGNMPVLKDLIVDMDAVHWKKIKRVTPWLLAKQPVPEREYIVAERVDGRRHPDDGLHPVRRLRVGLPGDGGRPGLHRPGGPREGLPLRRRPPRRSAVRAPQGPRPGPPGDLRLHPLLQVRGGLPQGRQPDGTDHASTADRDRRPPHRRPEQRRAPRGGVHRTDQGQRPAVGGRTASPLLRRQLVVRQIPPRRRQRAAQLVAVDHHVAAAPQGDADGGAETTQAPEQRSQERAGDLRQGRGP